jgi:hypothetical protein
MLATNRQFQSLLWQVDSQISAMEHSAARGEAKGRVFPAIEELRGRRRALKLLLFNRKIEAAKTVVNFHRWRDGNGALYLCTTPPARRKRARA